LEVEQSIDKYIKQLLNLIRSNYLSTPASSKSMDLAQKTQYLTLDVISDIGFGQAFGDLEADTDVDNYIRSGGQGLRFLSVTCALGLLPILQWPPLARLIGPSEKDRSGHGKMMATARRFIDARLMQPTNKRSDMLASFIRHGLNTEELRTEAFLQILAGSDTTATAIRGTMLYLVSNPPVYLKLQKEIDAAVASGIASGTVVSDAAARELPYLQAVLREGFRIHPPVTDIAPKQVPKGGDTVNVEGKCIFLPGGTNVGFSVFGLNSRKDIFGEDADQFRPERWLVGDDESETHRVDTMRRTTELIFGYGKYQCLGKNIAWMEYSKAVFEVCLPSSQCPYILIHPEASATF
jgi:cytochrome P450